MIPRKKGRGRKYKEGVSDLAGPAQITLDILKKLISNYQTYKSANESSEQQEDADFDEGLVKIVDEAKKYKGDPLIVAIGKYHSTVPATKAGVEKLRFFLKNNPKYNLILKEFDALMGYQ